MPLNERQLRQYEDDGFLIVENLLTMEELQPMIAEINQQVKALAKKLYDGGRIRSEHNDKNFYTQLIAISEEFEGTAPLFQIDTAMGPALANLWSCDKLLDIVEQVIGPDIEGGAIWNVRSKVPNNVLMTVPWHQDTAYLQPIAQTTVQPACWIPLIDATVENGCLQVVRGGHRSDGNYKHYVEKRVRDPRSWYLFIKEEDLPKGEIVTCEMKMGSVLFINENAPHRGLWNHSDKVRWAIDFRWQRPGDPTGLEGMLRHGPIMRRGDPDYRPDMARWVKAERESYDAFAGRGDVDPYDPTISGAWLDRWDHKKLA